MVVIRLHPFPFICLAMLSAPIHQHLFPDHHSDTGCEAYQDQGGVKASHAGLVSTEVVTPRATIRNIRCSFGVSLSIRQTPMWTIM
jgi:hypothetical protein